MSEPTFEEIESNPHLKASTSDQDYEAAWAAFLEDSFDPDNPYGHQQATDEPFDYDWYWEGE